MSNVTEPIFDAQAYLENVDPSQKYTIDVLAGGIMNLTFRGTKAGDLKGGRFPEHMSLVMKYAPPYIAGMGSGYPLTTYRQEIEARVLSLFNDSVANNLAWITTESLVSTPALLHYDPERHVIIMSDKGKLTNLAAVFTELVGYIGPQREDNMISATNDSSSPSPRDAAASVFGSVGDYLGSFFAKLHSPRALSAIVDDTERGKKYLDNPHLGSLAFEGVIRLAKENLMLFPNLLDTVEATELYDRIVGNCTSSDPANTCTLALTDCWPGALLVDHLGTIEDEGPAELTVAVVDWEFAGIGRGLNGDMAQLLGQFSMMECAANCNADTVRGEQLRTLMTSMGKAYRQVSFGEGSRWTTRASLSDAEGFAALEPKTPRTQMLRSAFLTYGAEIVHWALIKPWKCRNPACLIDQKHTTVKQECATIQEMIKRAVWYLQHAKDDESEFCSLENQHVLRQARNEGQWLLEFF